MGLRQSRADRHLAIDHMFAHDLCGPSAWEIHGVKNNGLITFVTSFVLEFKWPETLIITIISSLVSKTAILCLV